MSTENSFQFIEATKVVEQKPAAAGEHNVGDDTKLPKQTDVPAELGLYDDSVSDPGFSKEELDRQVQTHIAIATAADDLEANFDEVKRVSAAVECLRQIPSAHLNPSVIAMFETHLPSGGKRVARESAMTPNEMRRVAIESTGGFFAGAKEALAKIWAWIKARVSDFIGLFTSKEAKVADAEKELDKATQEAEKNKATLPVKSEAQAKEASSSALSVVGGQVCVTVQPTVGSRVFVHGFTTVGINKSLDEAFKNVQAVEAALKPLVEVTKAGAKLDEFDPDTVMSALPYKKEGDHVICSLDQGPKIFTIGMGESAFDIKTEIVDKETPDVNEPLVMKLSDVKKCVDRAKSMTQRMAKAANTVKHFIELAEKDFEKRLPELEKLMADRPEGKQELEMMRKSMPFLARMLNHIMAGTAYHPNLMLAEVMSISTKTSKAALGQIAGGKTSVDKLDTSSQAGFNKSMAKESEKPAGFSFG